MCPDLPKICHFGKILKVFGFGNFLNGLYCMWQTFVPTLAFYATGQILFVVSGQRLNNNIAIWSHWFSPTLVVSRSWSRRWTSCRCGSKGCKARPADPAGSSARKRWTTRWPTSATDPGLTEWGCWSRTCRHPTKQLKSWGAAIAQWISLRLPFRCPGFESRAHHLRFYQS